MTSILEEAAELVNGARQASYGHPAINHGTTAELWAIYLGRKNPGVVVTAEDVCFMNMLQKISRHMNTPKRDNLVDLAGYAENAGMIAVLEEEEGEIVCSQIGDRVYHPAFGDGSIVDGGDCGCHGNYRPGDLHVHLDRHNDGRPDHDGISEAWTRHPPPALVEDEPTHGC